MICKTDNAAVEVYPILPPISKIACKTTKINMNLPALVCFSQQDVYTSLTILGCTVNCRLRFADCPLIHYGTCPYILVYQTQHLRVVPDKIKWGMAEFIHVCLTFAN